MRQDGVMPTNESVLIDGFIAAAQEERDQPLPDDVAFETFAAQMVLRNKNLSDEEIESGRIGGGKDGGIDGIYVFLDDTLLTEDNGVFDPGFASRSVRKKIEIELHLIQAKRETSFTETALDKASSSLRRLLDLNQSHANLRVYYSDEVISQIRLFTRAWQALSLRSPRISITFDYVTKGDVSSVGAPTEQKARDLEAELERHVPGADARVRTIGARELWETAGTVPQYDLQLRFREYLSKGESYTGLVGLADFYEFLSDENGALRGHLFDWNVRDFQGEVAVNRDIQQTLQEPGAEDFWWLNNGVTILCSDVGISGDKTFTMENVQIVNGMQTSFSIHSAIAKIGTELERPRERSLLVRVFKTQDEAIRDRIIRATNSQTKVLDASLHATEDIHRQLEAYFQSHGWYYDRRKNYYKNTGMPADRIVSISALGQAVMSMGLSRPDDARARPSTLLKNSGDYAKVFSPRVPLQTYLWLAQVQRKIDSLLLKIVDGELHLRTNYRFGISLYLVTNRNASRIFSPVQLASITGDSLDLSEERVDEVLSILTGVAAAIGEKKDWGEDRVVKSRDFAEAVVKAALDASVVSNLDGSGTED